MTWLSEIVEEAAELNAIYRNKFYGVEIPRMARVIRELVNVVRYIELDEGDVIIYAPEALIRSMNVFSPDTKEVIDKQVGG